MFFSIVERLFVRRHKPRLKILEVGSYDITGSIRQFFDGCDYVGADLVAGPGVDLVCSGHEISFDDCSFDLTLSSECFEHNPYWLETFRNMHRMTKPGGLVVFSCASRGRAEHGTSRTTEGRNVSPGTMAAGWEYYRNLNRSDFERALDMHAMFSAYLFIYMPTSCDLYFCGQKHGEGRFALDTQALAAAATEISRLPFEEPMPRAKAMLVRLHRLPITLMSYVLEDRAFQNFRIRYLNALRPFSSFIKGRLSR
jgi:SAM-dependent methyltransferase